MTTRNIVENGLIEISLGGETIRAKWSNLTRVLTDPIAVHQLVTTLTFGTIQTLWSAAANLPASFDYLLIQMDPEGELTGADDELDIEITGDGVVQTLRMKPGTPIVLTDDASGGADVSSMDGLVTLVRARHNGASGDDPIKVRIVALKGA